MQNGAPRISCTSYSGIVRGRGEAAFTLHTGWSLGSAAFFLMKKGTHQETEAKP